MEAAPVPWALVLELNPATHNSHLLLQEALNAIDRVHSASSFTVAPCGQLQVACGQVAPEPEALLDAEMLDTEILPFVDGIITSAGNASIDPVFAFSASTDPGVPDAASMHSV